MSIRLDLQRLADSSRRLRALHEEFTGVERFDEGLSDASGDERLGGALADFGSAWNRRREVLADQVLHAADAAITIHDAFVDLDQGLANTARGEG